MHLFAFIRPRDTQAAIEDRRPGKDRAAGRRHPVPGRWNDACRYYGQYVALAVADTFETA